MRLKIYFFFQTIACVYGSLVHASADSRCVPGGFKPQRVHFPSQSRVEIFIPWSSSSAYNWIFALWSSGYIWLRLLPFWWPREGRDLSWSMWVLQVETVIFKDYVWIDGHSQQLYCDKVIASVLQIRCETSAPSDFINFQVDNSAYLIINSYLVYIVY